MSRFLTEIVEHHSLKLSSPINEFLVDRSKISDIVEKVENLISEKTVIIDEEQSTSPELLYGEIDSQSFLILMEVIKNSSNSEYFPAPGEGWSVKNLDYTIAT